MLRRTDPVVERILGASAVASFGHRFWQGRRALAMRLALAAMTAALAGAAPAAADRWKAADVRLAIQVADAHWPASPCFGEHQITWLRGAELDGVFPDDDSATAEGEVGGCRVWVAWDRVDPSAAWLCTILEHEFGHNAGLGHSSDPHEVMYPWQANTAADCKRAFTTRAAPRVARHRPHRHL